MRLSYETHFLYGSASGRNPRLFLFRENYFFSFTIR